MKISDLKAGSSKVELEAKVIEKKEVREVNTKFGSSKVCNAILEDDTGNIELTLWGEDTDKYDQGDTLKIENGFVKEWNGNLQLSAGKYGKITKVEA